VRWEVRGGDGERWGGGGRKMEDGGEGNKVRFDVEGELGGSGGWCDGSCGERGWGLANVKPGGEVGEELGWGGY